MPTSLEGVERPAEMLRAGRPEDQAFEETEALYHRIRPDYVHEYEQGKFRVVTWNYLHNISVVRGKYAQPDHARWDSATPPEDDHNFKPQLYRDWYVARILVSDIPAELASSGDTTFTFAVVHVPYDDLYAHSEIRAKKNGNLVKHRNKFGSEEVKSQYRAALSNKAVIVLKPDTVEIAGESAAGSASIAADSQAAAPAAPPCRPQNNRKNKIRWARFYPAFALTPRSRRKSSSVAIG